MTPDQIFNLIRTTTYNRSGLEIDWKIIVDEVDGVIRLLFQETNGKQDWKTNLDFPVKPYKRQQKCFFIHRGFAKAWKSCNDEIMKAFIDAKMRFPLYKTQISGWSHGGGLAPLAAEDFKFRTGVKVDELITFGAPKIIFGIGSLVYFRKVAKTIHNYCFAYDFITWVPPFYCNVKKTLLDKKNCWKMWRVFQIVKYHCGYGEKEYYC